jgi:hypothetical protein
MAQYKRRLTWSHKLDKWSDADEADGSCDRGRGFGCSVSEQYKNLNAGMAFRASNTGDGVESRFRQAAKHPPL